MVGIEVQVVEVVVGGIASRHLDDGHLVVDRSVDGVAQTEHGGTEHTPHRMVPPGRQPGPGGGLVMDGVGGLQPRQPLFVGPVLGILRRLRRAHRR